MLLDVLKGLNVDPTLRSLMLSRGLRVAGA